MGRTHHSCITIRAQKAQDMRKGVKVEAGELRQVRQREACPQSRTLPVHTHDSVPKGERGRTGGLKTKRDFTQTMGGRNENCQGNRVSDMTSLPFVWW